ncbi:family 43 glycosylhydrolase [Microbacterium jejuense]|uniref:family 43 glycosylhydrolase n=1 Tax=Microbacterium jejuense TaxID=1263637 RepID=UPI0031EBC438
MTTTPLTGMLRPTQKSTELLLAPTHRAGDWNSHGVDCPFVFRRDGVLGMTVVGWDGRGYQTGLSWHDGHAWSAPQLVFPRDEASPHRRHNAALTALLRDTDLYGAGELIAVDGWYYGTYHAYPDAGYEAGSAVIGFVRSRDLRHWEDVGDILRPEEGGDWERGGLYKSYLLRHDGRFWLFYNAKNRVSGSWVEQTGAAVSDDLASWQRVSDAPLLSIGPAGSPDDRFASDPFVLRAADGTWIMFYFGLRAGGPAVDLYATSPDLVEWTKSPDVLVHPGAPGAIDDWHAHKPAVIRTDDRLEHYYCAVQRLAEPIDIDGYRQFEGRGIALAWSQVPG